MPSTIVLCFFKSLIKFWRSAVKNTIIWIHLQRIQYELGKVRITEYKGRNTAILLLSTYIDFLKMVTQQKYYELIVISRQFSYAISHYFNPNWCYSIALIMWKRVSILNQVKSFSSKACRLFGKLRKSLVPHEDKI